MTPDLLFLFFSLFTWGIGEGIFMYFQPLYLQQWGADPHLIGIVFSGLGISMMVMQIPAGILTDRIGPRPILRVSWLLGVLACLIMAVARSLEMFIVGMMVYGFSAFGITPMNTFITQARGRLSAERALTFISGGFNAGAVLGPIMGGIIANHSGIHQIYFYSFAVFILSTILVFFLRRQGTKCEPHNRDKLNSHRNPRFIALLPLVFITIFALYLPQPLIPNYLQDQKLMSLTQIGQLGAIGNIGNAVIILGLGRFSSVSGYFLGQILVVLSIIVLLKGGNVFWYAGGYFLMGGYRLTRIMLVAYARSFIRSFEIGRAFGYLESVNGLAVILAPIIAGYIYEISPEKMFISALIAIMAAIIINGYFMVFRWRKPYDNSNHSIRFRPTRKQHLPD